jgi:predicted nucleic acid-binding protein
VTLRALDAIHVASAIYASESLDGIITYDKKMGQNAGWLNIPIASPGVKK